MKKVVQIQNPRTDSKSPKLKLKNNKFAQVRFSVY